MRRLLLPGMLAIWLVILCLPMPGIAAEPTPHPALALAYQVSAEAKQQAVLKGLHPEDETGEVGLCLGCAQPYAEYGWDIARDTVSLTPLDRVGINMLDMQFAFFAADEHVSLGIDLERMASLIGTIYNEIPEAYRRKQIDTVIIIVSSDPYCLRYDAWTNKMRQGLVDDLSSYFTAEASLEDNSGCCASFPNTKERERVIWLPVGLALSASGEKVEHANCAYSYHVRCTEELNLTMRLIHELIHALAISRTLPSLEEYGFVPNLTWELQWMARGNEPARLVTAEAFAYDLSRKIMRTYWPGMVIGAMP